MKLHYYLLLIIAVEVSGFIQYLLTKDVYGYPYLTIVFVTIFLIDMIKKHISCRKLNETKMERFKYLGKKVKSGELVEIEDCPICWDKMDKISCLCITNCNHVFHNSCINSWRKSNNSCPLCRTKICMERELPIKKSPSNILDYDFFKNSCSNIKGFIDEVLDDDNAMLLFFGEDSRSLHNENTNLA